MASRRFALVLNLALRLAIVYFLAETMLFSDDPRFAGKAIPIRNFVIVGGASLLFPIAYLLRRKKASYPLWTDFLYLSIFGLDMAGNSFNLYDTIFYFDLLPHFYGTGAATLIFYLLVLARDFFGKIRISRFEAFILSFGAATILHAGLEVQEYYTDVLAGTHNVRGVFDVINDLFVGFLGSISFIGLFELFLKGKTRAQTKRLLAPIASLFAHK